MNNTATNARQHKFDNIPDELKARKQWVVWKHYQRDGTDKFTKMPWQLWDNAPGKIGLNQTTFDVAVQQYMQGRVDGIGFVFTVDDPYTGVDLDVDGDQPARWQIDVVQQLDSYTERSPSGRGVHVIVKGDVPLAVKSPGIEFYSEDRFFTFTGDIVDGRDTIKPRQQILNDLWNTHKNSSKVLDSEYTIQQLEAVQKPTVQDEQIVKFVSSGANAAHWYGRTSDPSASYYSILRAACVVSGDEQQVQRVVLSAPLMGVPTGGKETRTQKVLRLWDREYYPAALRGAAERLADQPWIEHGASVVARIAAMREEMARQQSETVIKIKEQEKPLSDALSVAFSTIPVSTWSDIAFRLPPGAAGDLCREILKRQRTPNPKFAVWALTGYLSGVMGRSYLVDGFHLRQFSVLVSHSNTGKTSHWSAMEKMANKLTRFAFAKRVINGGVSSPQVINALGMEQPSMCLRMADGGQQLLDIISGTTLQNNSVRAALHSIYDAGQEGGRFAAPKSVMGRQQERKDIDQFNMSLVVDTTFEHANEFGEADFKDGLMSRMLVTYAEETNSQLQRPYTGEYTLDTARTFGALLEASKQSSMPSTLADHETDAKPIQIETPQEVDELSWALECELNEVITTKVQAGLLDAVYYAYSRIVLNTKTVAAMIAAINNPLKPVITRDVFEWAFKYVCLSCATLVERVENGTIGSQGRKELQAFKDVMIKQLTFAGKDAPGVKLSVVRQRCIERKVFAKSRVGANQMFSYMVKQLTDDGSIVIEKFGDTDGKYGTKYVVPVYESGFWD